MKRTVIGIACGLVLLNTVGCVIAVDRDVVDADSIHRNTIWETQQEENRNKISALELQLTYTKALALMGTPDFSDQFEQQNANYQVLYYRTHATQKRAKQEDCTPLLFKNKQLVGWGKGALAQLER